MLVGRFATCLRAPWVRTLLTCTLLTSLILYFSFWRFCGRLTYSDTTVCQRRVSKMFATGRNVPPQRLTPDPSVPPVRPVRPGFSTLAHQRKHSPRTKSPNTRQARITERRTHRTSCRTRSPRARPFDTRSISHCTRASCLVHATTGAPIAHYDHPALTRAFLLPTRACATGVLQWTELFLAGDTPTPTLPAVSRNNNNNNGAGAGAGAGRGVAKGKKGSARFERSLGSRGRRGPAHHSSPLHIHIHVCTLFFVPPPLRALSLPLPRTKRTPPSSLPSPPPPPPRPLAPTPLPNSSKSSATGSTWDVVFTRCHGPRTTPTERSE